MTRQDEQRSAGSVAWRVLLLGGVLVIAVGMLYLRTFPPTATVMSDSMEPKISVGDIVLFKATGGATPSVGDVVEIKVPQELQQKHDYPSAVIHRVVAVNGDGTVTTKGDNLDSEDPFHAEISSIRREVVFTIPMAGRALGFLFSPFGFLWIGLGVLIFVVMPFYDVQRQRSALQQVEVATLAELQAKIDRATTWTIQADGGVAPYASHGPPPGGAEDQSYRMPFAPPGAGPFGGRGEVRVVVPEADVDDRIEALVSAVGDYGHHLRSHTEILKSMSAASQDLARVVADLQQTVAAPPPLVDQVLELDATALHHLTASGVVQVEAVAPGRYRVRPR